MDGPVDWWWKMSLLDVCVQAGFCQIRSQLKILLMHTWSTVNDESLAWLKIGETTLQSFWQHKVLRIYLKSIRKY